MHTPQEIHGQNAGSASSRIVLQINTDLESPTFPSLPQPHLAHDACAVVRVEHGEIGLEIGPREVLHIAPEPNGTRDHVSVLQTEVLPCKPSWSHRLRLLDTPT